MWRLVEAKSFRTAPELFAGVVFARALGLHLPFHVSWRELVVVGFLATKRSSRRVCSASDDSRIATRSDGGGIARTFNWVIVDPPCRLRSAPQ